MKKNKFSFFFVIFIFSFFNTMTIADEIFKKGKDLFLNKANCQSCHTLKDAGSNAQIGPNLNEIRPSQNRVINAVMNGIGVMPAYQGQLSLQEIEAVSYYVSVAANQ